MTNHLILASTWLRQSSSVVVAVLGGFSIRTVTLVTWILLCTAWIISATLLSECWLGWWVSIRIQHLFKIWTNAEHFFWWNSDRVYDWRQLASVLFIFSSQC